MEALANNALPPDEEPSEGRRLAAHERLSTGALAAWTRACAAHPWRVVAGWIGVVVVPVDARRPIGDELRPEPEPSGA